MVTLASYEIRVTSSAQARSRQTDREEHSDRTGFTLVNPTHKEIRYKVSELMDEYRAFRSTQASGYARESIGLLVRERGIPSGERT